jgi:hypothetical protein
LSICFFNLSTFFHFFPSSFLFLSCLSIYLLLFFMFVPLCFNPSLSMFVFIFKFIPLNLTLCILLNSFQTWQLMTNKTY